MVEEKKVKAKPIIKRDKFVENALKHYNELLESKIDFDREFKPLEQYLIKMGKIVKKERKKKA